MKLEVTLLDGTIIEPKFDEKNKKEVVEFYRKLAQQKKIKSFCATHGSGTNNEQKQKDIDTQ